MSCSWHLAETQLKVSELLLEGCIRLSLLLRSTAALVLNLRRHTTRLNASLFNTQTCLLIGLFRRRTFALRKDSLFIVLSTITTVNLLRAIVSDRLGEFCLLRLTYSLAFFCWLLNNNSAAVFDYAAHLTVPIMPVNRFTLLVTCALTLFLPVLLPSIFLLFLLLFFYLFFRFFILLLLLCKVLSDSLLDLLQIFSQCLRCLYSSKSCQLGRQLAKRRKVIKCW